tara:strand:+ start:70182 stop:70400 length:219 start_codon:yes stop_codon:yes gene_type:complete
MNNLVKMLFVAVNKQTGIVVFAETNLKAFVEGCKSKIGLIQSVSYYRVKFKEQEVLYHTDNFGRQFILQKVK